MAKGNDFFRKYKIFFKFEPHDSYKYDSYTQIHLSPPNSTLVGNWEMCRIRGGVELGGVELGGELDQ